MKQLRDGFILETSVIALFAITDVLLWGGVVAFAFPTSATVATVGTGPLEIARAAIVPPIDAVIGVGIPARIRIQRIGIDAVVESVGLTKDGAMDVPALPLDAGWYSYGQRPGETGSAVIDGHVDWYAGQTGAFKNLKDARPGDEIVIEDDAGAVVTFVVREIRTYDAAADATAVFVSDDGNAHLNLITCGGKWDKLAGQYPDRLVVFADRTTPE
ncbi:MAG: class F sortase [Candidatus Uhrbacteria bacterium]